MFYATIKNGIVVGIGEHPSGDDVLIENSEWTLEEIFNNILDYTYRYSNGVLTREHSEIGKLKKDPPYDVKRRREYPTVENQLDMLYKAMELGEIPKASEWFNTIKTVKDNNPKPTS